MSLNRKDELDPDLIGVCVLASISGLSCGFFMGLSGVTAMDSFQKSFFPSGVINFTEHLICSPIHYLVGCVACLPTSFVIQAYGKRASIILGGLSFFVGAVFTGTASNLTLFNLGRVMLGVGAAFGNQAVPVYLSELVPPKHRGLMGCQFQYQVASGIGCSAAVNLGICYTGSDVWNISYGVVGQFALLMMLFGLFLPETPYDLVSRACHRQQSYNEEQGRSLLVRIRGTEEVDAEFDVIKRACKGVGRAPRFRCLLQRETIPPLVMAIFIPFFQQFTGINAIFTYATLKSIKGSCSGYGLFIATLNAIGTLFCLPCIEDWGRKVFLLKAGFPMFLSLVTLAMLSYSGVTEGAFYHFGTVALLIAYISAYAWSWGPLGLLIPSEIFPADTRTAGQAVAVASSMLFTFILDSFPAMVDNLGYGVFIFFAGWVLVMTAFVYWFVPETNHVPLEDVGVIWQKHWFWKRFCDKASTGMKLH